MAETNETETTLTSEPQANDSESFNKRRGERATAFDNAGPSATRLSPASTSTEPVSPEPETSVDSTEPEQPEPEQSTS